MGPLVVVVPRSRRSGSRGTVPATLGAICAVDDPSHAERLPITDLRVGIGQRRHLEPVCRPNERGAGQGPRAEPVADPVQRPSGRSRGRRRGTAAGSSCRDRPSVSPEMVIPSRVQPAPRSASQLSASSRRPVSSRVAVVAVEAQGGRPGGARVKSSKRSRSVKVWPIRSPAQPSRDPVDQAREQGLELTRLRPPLARPIAHCDPIDRRRRPTSTGHWVHQGLASAHGCRLAALPTVALSSTSLPTSQLADRPDALRVGFAAVIAPTPRAARPAAGAGTPPRRRRPRSASRRAC